MFKVSNSFKFHVKILESHWWTNAVGLYWIPGTDAFVSSGTAPLVEVLAGLVGLTCRTGSLCTSLSGLVSGFTSLVLTVSLQVSGTACFFSMLCHPTELCMICLKASQCRFLSPMFDSYEVV